MIGVFINFYLAMLYLLEIGEKANEKGNLLFRSLLVMTGLCTSPVHRNIKAQHYFDRKSGTSYQWGKGRNQGSHCRNQWQSTSLHHHDKRRIRFRIKVRCFIGPTRKIATNSANLSPEEMTKIINEGFSQICEYMALKDTAGFSIEIRSPREKLASTVPKDMETIDWDKVKDLSYFLKILVSMT